MNNPAGRRLDRAVELNNRINELERVLEKALGHQRLTAQYIGSLSEQLGGIRFEARRELKEAKDAVLEEHAHHMDPHPTAESVLPMAGAHR